MERGMPGLDESDQDKGQVVTVDSNRVSAQPGFHESNTQPTGADIVAALANSPLAIVNFARLSIRAKVRSEPHDMDEWL
jgi:hypothetical protein